MLVRAEREENGDRLFIVAGTARAVEMRRTEHYCVFYVHSPAWRADLAQSSVQLRWAKAAVVPGLARHRCSILEGDCWCGLVGCGSYDFDAPDAGTVVQWAALEDLYRRSLGSG